MNDAPPVTHCAERPPKSFLGPLFILAVIACLLAIVPGFIFFEPAMVIYQADEGFKHAKRTINAEELRQWALQEITKRSGTKDSKIPASEIPDYIQNLYSSGPEDAVAIPGGTNEQPHVLIIWGGGFFHWVMEIGDTNYSEPYVNEYSEGRYNFEWTNGIYYSRQARWKLW